MAKKKIKFEPLLPSDEDVILEGGVVTHIRCLGCSTDFDIILEPSATRNGCSPEPQKLECCPFCHSVFFEAG